MKAAVLHGFGEALRLEERARPQPRGNEIVVRVLAAGVCHTDLHIVDGRFPHLPLPLVLGHEIAGEAEGIGPVLVYASWGCGSCALCAQGEEQLCPQAAEPGWLRDGGYAEWIRVPGRRYLVPLGDLDPVRAAPLADAGLTPYRAVRRVASHLDSGSTAVVFGAGGLGQFAIQYLRLLSAAHVVVVEPSEARRDRALALGAHQALSPEAELPPARAVLDFIGSAQTLARAAAVVERAGCLVLVGEAGGRIPFGFGAVPHETQLTTSVWGSRRELEEVLRLAHAGQLDWDVETLGLDEVNEALARLRGGTALGRLVLVPA